MVVLKNVGVYQVGKEDMKKVHVEVWSDFVCPWCWIAKRRFEAAVDLLSNQVEVVATAKSYRLARGMPPMDFKTTLHKKFGNQAAADRMMAAVGQAGSSEGLLYNFDSMLFGDTTAAHILVKSILHPEIAEKMSERLFKAATTDGIDIFNRRTLLALAQEMGIGDMKIEFDSPEILSSIAQDEFQANQISNGVPLFLFNGKSYLSGAQDVTVFQQALLQASTNVMSDAASGNGESCGIDGCTS